MLEGCSSGAWNVKGQLNIANFLKIETIRSHLVAPGLAAALNSKKLIDCVGLDRTLSGTGLSLGKIFLKFFLKWSFSYLEHPQNLHPALVGVLLLVPAVLSSLGEPGEGHVEDLEQDDGGDGGALVHGGVDVPQSSGHVEAVLSTSYADFPGELKRRKIAQ